jgi:hypothetical protein
MPKFVLKLYNRKMQAAPKVQTYPGPATDRGKDLTSLLVDQTWTRPDLSGGPDLTSGGPDLTSGGPVLTPEGPDLTF